MMAIVPQMSQQNCFSLSKATLRKEHILRSQDNEKHGKGLRKVLISPTNKSLEDYRQVFYRFAFIWMFSTHNKTLS